MEKNFLIGIRDDLGVVKKRLENDKYFQPTRDYYDSVWVQMNEHRINKAFVDSNSGFLLNTNYFTYDDSQFENFKSSGNLRLIENDSLLRNITSLYNDQLPWLKNRDYEAFGNRLRDFITYIAPKARIDSTDYLNVISLKSIFVNTSLKTVCT